MGYQDIPSGTVPGAGAGSGEILVTATDTVGGFLDGSLTTTPADITKAVVNGGADETLNLSLPNVGPGAGTSGTAAAPIQTATTDARGRIVSFGTAVARDVPASWALTLVRYFLVDYDAGSDSNVGYIDAAAGTVHSGAAVAAAAIKTFTKLMTIVPLLGNGRTMVVLVKNRAAGAAYLDNDGITESIVRWGGLSGYKTILRRGSTDLTNSTTDRVLCGFITALTGPNGDGSFTVLAGATTTVFSVTGTPFTAEPGILGLRVRFTGDVTPALANVVMNIAANTSSQITLGAAVTLPAVGNTFFIEGPGVVVAEYADSSSGNGYIAGGGSPSTPNPTVRDVGFSIKAASAASNGSAPIYFQGGSRNLSGMEQTSESGGFVFESMDSLVVGASYMDETETSRDTGFGFRTKATGIPMFRLIKAAYIAAVAWVRSAPTGIMFVADIRAGFIFTQGSYLQANVRYRGLGTGIVETQAQAFSTLMIGNGYSTTLPRTRQKGQATIEQSSAAFAGIQFSGAGNGAAVRADLGDGGGVISFDNCTDDGTCTGYGLDAQGASGKRFLMGRGVVNTFTGTLGDIRANGAAILTHVGLTRTNVNDNAGCSFIGTAGEIAGPCTLVTNSSGGALAIGDVVRGNGTTAQVTSSFATALATAPAFGVMVTAPANAAAGYMATHGTPSVNFDGAPTPGAIAYGSVTTTRQATTTIPPLAATNQKIRLGRVVITSGTTGRVAWYPESLPVVADGLA